MSQRVYREGKTVRVSWDAATSSTVKGETRTFTMIRFSVGGFSADVPIPDDAKPGDVLKETEHHRFTMGEDGNVLIEWIGKREAYLVDPDKPNRHERRKAAAEERRR